MTTLKHTELFIQKDMKIINSRTDTLQALLAVRMAQKMAFFNSLKNCQNDITLTREYMQFFFVKIDQSLL